MGHEFGRLYVEGYQDDEGTGVLKAVATPKHFDVFAGPGNAPCPDDKHPDNQCDVEIGMRDCKSSGRPSHFPCGPHRLPIASAADGSCDGWQG